jgi:hypothetical protein
MVCFVKEQNNGIFFPWFRIAHEVNVGELPTFATVAANYFGELPW